MTVEALPSVTAGHRVPLGDTGWLLWRSSVLRAAGFPVSYVRRLADDTLLDPPDDLDPAIRRCTAALAGIGTDPAFVEAVTWQNPRLVWDWLRDLDPAPARRLDRRKEEAITSYIQRYATKNDTIGFFGPVGWATWDGGPEAVSLQVPRRWLGRRSVYFECWAIDAVARRFSGEPGLAPWLRPRLVSSCWCDGTAVHRPFGPPLPLNEWQADLLRRCDGRHTVFDLGPDALAQLVAWRDCGVLRLGFDGPIETWPEAALRRRLAELPPSSERDTALGALDELVAARDAVARAAGNPALLLPAFHELHATFERIADRPSTRRAGRSYAGRTLIYEDAQRATTARLGAPLLTALAPPLALLLASARWLTNRVAHLLRRGLIEAHEEATTALAPAEVPLPVLLERATPLLMASGDAETPLRIAAAELRAKWSRVLAVPPQVRAHTVRSEAIHALVEAEFPAPPEGRVPWAAAVHYCPDIMIAATSLDALNRGEFSIVLGELHVAVNTLEARPMVQQHPEPDALLASAEADYPDGRVYAVPAKASPLVNSRTYPSALLSPKYTFWSLHSDGTGAPGPMVPAASMTVRRDGDSLVVRSPGATADLDLIEVLGEQLSALVADAFSPIASAPHVPRITIDRLVVARERWRFDPTSADLGWALVRVETQRLRLVHAWRRRHGIPLRAFYTVPGERKPTYVDFSSLTLVALFAKAVRRARTRTPREVSVVEMLPDLDQTWLDEGRGAPCTAEFRLVVVDPSIAGRA